VDNNLIRCIIDLTIGITFGVVCIKLVRHKEVIKKIKKSYNEEPEDIEEKENEEEEEKKVDVFDKERILNFLEERRKC
jgi:hypothetical protein